jgi:RNA-splicing ligase RtcB
MPDCHAGKGSVIGFTATIKDYVIPNIVGVDIGCGIEAYNLGKIQIDFEKLDHHIRKHIPSGFEKRGKKLYEISTLNKLLKANMEDVCEDTRQNLNDVLLSLGTLGGGNHFIEVDEDVEGNRWLVVHTGSRNFGKRICEFHQNKAKELMHKTFNGDAYKDLEFLPMDMGGEEYLADMRIAQRYAALNRKSILDFFLRYFDVKPIDYILSVHNYIDDEGMIRKGAISAKNDEKLLIPLNMRDGVIVGRGKGKADWNWSAPHGAGRILSRGQAKRNLVLDEYKKEMEGIYTTSVSMDTIDESPMAYKSKDTILSSIEEEVIVDFVMKPVYNFKAGRENK